MDEDLQGKGLLLEGQQVSIAVHQHRSRCAHDLIQRQPVVAVAHTMRAVEQKHRYQRVGIENGRSRDGSEQSDRCKALEQSDSGRSCEPADH